MNDTDVLWAHMVSEHDVVPDVKDGHTALYIDHRQLHHEAGSANHSIWDESSWNRTKVFETFRKINEHTKERPHMSEESSLRELIAQGRIAEQILNERYPAAQQPQPLSPEQEKEKWPRIRDPLSPQVGYPNPQWMMIDFEEQAQPPQHVSKVRKWCPKLLREWLCNQQTFAPDNLTLTEMQRLINILDLHRPLGSDGKHGDLHTPTCGCEDK